MKRKVISLLLITAALIIFIFFYTFKPMTMNDIYDKPSFTGTVMEVDDNSIMVSVNEDEDEYKSSDKIVVSLDVKLKDTMTDFHVGNEVIVYYDGDMAEIYPSKINKVYAIVLVSD